jgi:hypothetical protein
LKEFLDNAAAASVFPPMLTEEYLNDTTPGDGNQPKASSLIMQKQSGDNQTPIMQMPQPNIPRPVVPQVDTSISEKRPSVQERVAYPAAANFAPGEKRSSMSEYLIKTLWRLFD